MSIKRIGIKEFKDAGFLQEANRLFFHPHGLALEITLITDDERAPMYTFALPADEYDELVAATRDASEILRQRIEAAARYEVGDAYISGCWDDRDDPEGVWYDIEAWERDQPGATADFASKAAAVAAERERHREAREAMLGGSDIEAIPDQEN